jgi:signal transduction histidine kinase
VEVLVRSERARALFDRNAIAQATVVLNSAIVVVVLWGHAPAERLVAWAAALWLVVAARLALGVAFRRSGPPPGEAGRWAFRFTAGAAVNGVLWGVAPLLVGGGIDLAHLIFLAFVLGGMAAGGALSNASRQAAFLAFLVPAFLPILVLLFTGGDRLRVGMGVLLAVFGAAVTAISRSGGRALAEAVRLRFANVELARGLAELNADLERRVAERSAQLEAAVAREREAERQRASTARLAVIGTLAAGVAHEINSPAAALGANVRYLLEVLRAGEPVPPEAIASLADTSELNERIASYVRRLAEVSRVAGTDLGVGPGTLVGEAARIAVESGLARGVSSAPVAIEAPAGLRASIDREVLTQIVALLLRETTGGGTRPARITAEVSGGAIRLRVTCPPPAAGGLPARQAGSDLTVAGGLAAIYGGSVRATGPGEDPGLVLHLPAGDPVESPR